MFDLNSTDVQIFFQSKRVSVNGTGYSDLPFETVTGLPQNLNMITWLSDGRSHYYTMDMTKVDLDRTQENWDKWVQPFIDLWQVEYNKEHADEIYFPNRQAKALVQLNEDFETVKERSHIKSSLGFTVDANQTANENVNGLLITIGDNETVQFCDYNNQFHALTKADLETLQTEIIQNAQNLYQQKWVYRTQIEAATDNEGLDAVVAAISFSYIDFTPPAEEPTGDGEQAAETDQSTEQTE